MKSDTNALHEAMCILNGLLLGGPTMHMDAASRTKIREFLERETDPIPPGALGSARPPFQAASNEYVVTVETYRGGGPQPTRRDQLVQAYTAADAVTQVELREHYTSAVVAVRPVRWPAVSRSEGA